MKIENLHIREISGIISTDDILPAVYKHASTDPNFLKLHLFENICPNFTTDVESQSVIVANNLFGIGSSREQAVTALIAAGVKAIIAPSFGRIFYRNGWNLGLPLITLNLKIPDNAKVLGIDFSTSIISINQTVYVFPSVPQLMLNIMASGGLLEYYRNYINSEYE